MISSEAAPFAKTGGLADVVGSLPLALRSYGDEVAVVIPRYQSIELKNLRRVWDNLAVYFGPDAYPYSIYQAPAEYPVYLVDCPPLYDRKGFYGESGLDYPDNHIRFAVFCRAALSVARFLFRTDIFHCHDWQTGLVPAYLRTSFATDPAPNAEAQLRKYVDEAWTVLTALADPDVARESKQPPLADLGTLAVGFQELAAKAAAPPPPPAPLVASAPPQQQLAAPRVYTGGETGIVPPIAMVQTLPPFPGQVIIPRNGKLEIVIDESGLVESAMMTGSVSQNYDMMVLSATKAWRYKPATLNGAPVKFRKTVQINIKLTS
jgi:hypothetical protein